MTDDEVKQWLSDEEREAFDTVMPTRPAFRALAETREALSHFGDDTSMGCDFCDVNRFDGKPRHSDAPHKPDCIFSTMPRPK